MMTLVWGQTGVVITIPKTQYRSCVCRSAVCDRRRSRRPDAPRFHALLQSGWHWSFRLASVPPVSQPPGPVCRRVIRRPCGNGILTKTAIG